MIFCCLGSCQSEAGTEAFFFLMVFLLIVSFNMVVVFWWQNILKLKNNNYNTTQWMRLTIYELLYIGYYKFFPNIQETYLKKVSCLRPQGQRITCSINEIPNRGQLQPRKHNLSKQSDNLIFRYILKKVISCNFLIIKLVNVTKQRSYL